MKATHTGLTHPSKSKSLIPIEPIFILAGLYANSPFFYNNIFTNIFTKHLSRCLKNMENNDLIRKENDGEDPKNTEYFLTKKGKSLNKVFYELLIFAIENDVENKYYSETAKKELKNIYKEILKI